MQPAIDNDDAGRMLITYFTTQNSSVEIPSYEPFAVALHPWGSIATGPSALTGLPSYFTGFPVVGNLQPNGFIGDYHETYYWNLSDSLGARWSTAWTALHRVNGWYEAAVSGIR